MKKKIFFSHLALAIAVLLSGCGGGDDSSNSTGTVSMHVTDARPVLPSGTAKVSVTIDEVSVHSAGGGWTTLPLPQTPFIIEDLLQFAEGKKTQLVPPVQLTSGKYTQIRLSVSSATIKINQDVQPLVIPSENLKTVREFDFTVTGGGAVDLTVDFDLSQSIVVTGSGTYELKPVLHIVETKEAATVNGKINPSTFGANGEATVVVIRDTDDSGTITPGDEEYTRITVDKSSDTDATQFSIFWLVPDNGYVVQIEIGGEVIYTAPTGQMSPGAAVSLNGGNAI
jgi:hypothetical protein